MLELKNVFAGYGRHSVLNGIDAALGEGRLISIIGVNGCGKSTLLKAAAGILPITDGSISVDGIALGDMKRNEVAKRISYLSQGRSTPDMTVMQLVLHGRFPYLSYPRRYTAKDREIARAAMERVGMTALADRPLYTLSGGMRQTAYIAMALAQDTDYVLLDEPTTYLDVAHQLALMRMLRELADGGKGVVAVMHDLPLAFDFSDEIVVLGADGRVAAQGAPAALCRTDVISAAFGVELCPPLEGKGYFYRLQ